jgi:hypothetical protein
MRSPGVRIVNIELQQASQMPLVQNHHLIEHLASDTAKEPFDIRILPWAPWRDQRLSDALVVDPLPKVRAVSAVPVPQKIPWGLVQRECLHDLLCRPLGREMFSQVKVHDFRRLWARITSTKRILYVTVGTTKKSGQLYP